jgi:hypothetical protein
MLTLLFAFGQPREMDQVEVNALMVAAITRFPLIELRVLPEH